MPQTGERHAAGVQLAVVIGIGVSSLTVSKWEHAEGRIAMRSRTLAAFAGIRGMGKRDAQQALARE